MIKHSVHLIVVLIMAAVNLCGCSKRESLLHTKEEILDSLYSMTPKEILAFIEINRADYSYIDQIFIDSIFPALDEFSYLELKQLKPSFSKLYPELTEEFGNILAYTKFEFRTSITSELDAMEESFYTFINDELFPMLSLQTDSIVSESVSDIIDNYSGGLMNYRKLNFFTGRDEKEFQEIWEMKFSCGIIEDKTLEIISVFANNVSVAFEQYAKDCLDVKLELGNNIKPVPYESKLTSNQLEKIRTYTVTETDEIAVSAIRDFIIPTGLALIPGAGQIGKIYDTVTFLIDVNKIWQDIQNHKLSAEDILLSELIGHLENNKNNQGYVDAWIKIANDCVRLHRSKTERLILLKLDNI